MSRKKTISIIIAIALFGIALVYLFNATEPKTTRETATRKNAILVETQPVTRATFRPTIQAMGTVIPQHDLLLRSQVAGEVTSISPSFAPGATISRGTVLLRVDPAEYRSRLAAAKSELKQAITELEMEQGRSKVAYQDYQLFDTTLNDMDTSLILRKPHLAAAQARVEAAAAAVEKAEADLAKTTVRAPFDAHIISREVTLGSMVSTSQTLAHLLGTDSCWIEATVPIPSARWLSIADPQTKQKGSQATVHISQGASEQFTRSGVVTQIIRSVQHQTRLARVLISVADPLSRADSLQPPLFFGSFVTTSIQGNEIENVARVQRNHVRKANTVWVMKNDTLAIVSVTIAAEDASYAYITSGIDNGDLLIVSDLATVRSGIALRNQTQNASQNGAQL